MRPSVPMPPEADRPADPLVTVVTVVLDDAAGLARTAASVLGQEGARFEWLVVDGGSTDATLALIHELSPRITHWSSRPDAGIYDAMNRGMARAAGDYALFMNAGDRFAEQDSLARLVAAALRHDRPAVVCGGALFRYPSGIGLTRPARPVERCIWHQAPCSHQAMLIRADCLRAMPFETRFRLAADYAFVCRLFAQGERFCRIEAITAVTEHGGRSRSHREAWRLWREKLQIQRRILGAGPLVLATSAVRRLGTILGETILSLALLGRLRSLLASS